MLLPFTDSENTGGTAKVRGNTRSVRGPWDTCEGPSRCWLEITSLFITKPWGWRCFERRKGKKEGGLRRTKVERLGKRGDPEGTFRKQAAHQERMESQKPKETSVSRRKPRLQSDGVRREKLRQFTAQVGHRKPRCHF